MRLTLLATAALLVTPVSAVAQGLSDGSNGGQVTLYGWIPGISGDQEFPDGEPLVDLEPVDVLDALEFAFFGSGEIRRGRIGLVLDIAYADLGQDGEARGAIIPGADPAEASVDTKLLMATGVVAYRFLEHSGRWVDIYGGFRTFDVEGDVSLRVPALGFTGERSASVNWVDGIFGVRGHAPLGERVSATGLFDVGGFGIGSSSDLTWQVQGTLDYAFTERVIGRIGYRYMSIDRDHSALAMDADIHGPIVGVTWKF